MSLAPVPFSRRQEPQPRLSEPYVPGRHAESFWRAEEDEVLHAFYSTQGAVACREKLPRRSSTAIYARAHFLGLKGPRSGGPRKRRPNADALDAQILAAWPTLSGKGALQAFADAIGADRWFVSKRAATLGLTNPHRKEPNWTAAEDVLLAKLPLDDLRRAAAHFRGHGFLRTPASLCIRAKRLGISRRRRDILSATAAANILGVDIKWITARCIDGRLRAEKRGTQRLVQQGGDTWTITPADLRAFVIERLQEVDIRKVDRFAFVDLLVAQEAA